MFFRSGVSIVLGVILIAVGIVQLMMGWSYTEVSKREATTVGRIVHVFHGKSTIYKFLFQANGVAIRGDTGTCRTALTLAGCQEGAPVRVYYDPQQVTGALLEDFGAAAREKKFLGALMATCGLLLIGLHFVFKKALASPDESDEIDYDKGDDGPDNLHVVPNDWVGMQSIYTKTDAVG
jgi:hypothetical protein